VEEVGQEGRTTDRTTRCLEAVAPSRGKYMNNTGWKEAEYSITKCEFEGQNLILTDQYTTRVYRQVWKYAVAGKFVGQSKQE
jgi:hypothetical protein